jgi:endonuclease/exonuclease/phosphatase family metal-dependent hydrolase
LLLRQNVAVRVATFNIRHGAPVNGYRGDPDQLAAACAGLGVDVLALQEVDHGLARSKRAHLAQRAAEAAGMEMVFAPTMTLRGGDYGNALLVRGSIDEVEIVGLQPGYRFWAKREPRNAIVATARIGERRLSVAATHLSTQRSTSRGQLVDVIDALHRRDRPQLLMGDLNRTAAEVLGVPATEVLEFAAGPPTFPAIKPVLQIDHIAARGVEIGDVTAIRLPVSDHLALVAELVWSDERP